MSKTSYSLGTTIDDFSVVCRIIIDGDLSNTLSPQTITTWDVYDYVLIVFQIIINVCVVNICSKTILI